MTIEVGGVAATPTQITGLKTDLGLESAPNVPASSLRDRSTHTGTQLAVTVSDFTEASQDVIGAMVAAAGGSYDDNNGTITLPGGGVTVQDEGAPLSTAASTLNFTGAGVTATGSGGTKTINIPGAGSATITVKEDGAVVSTVITALDFLGADFDVAESPSGEANIVISSAIARAANVQPVDADLTAIAALTSAADKVPYATGAGAWALSDLTAAARTVLDDTTVVAMVNTLGGATSTGTGGLVRVDSAALTGTPTVPTASAATNTTQLATMAAVQAAIDAKVAGLMEIKGSINASANPNYPAASVGDAYIVPSGGAGRVGGASGKQVEVGDWVMALADNAGGSEASVGTSWTVFEHNIVGALLISNALSELSGVAGTARTNLGLAIGTDVQAYDATLAALAALTIAANSVTLGTAADAFSQITLAVNTFLARSSSGNAAAKPITDFGLSLIDDADAATGRATLGAAALGAAVKVVSATTYTVLVGDKGLHLVFTNASGCSATVPSGLGTDFGCTFAKIAAAGTVTFVQSSTTLINESGSLVLSALNGSGALMATNTADVFSLLGAFGAAAVTWAAEQTIASATTTDIGAAGSVNVAISGTTPITGLGTVAAGMFRQGRFTGALTLTHNATSLILPSGANITTAAGDRFATYSLGSGNWLVLFYQRADGTALVGSGTIAATVEDVPTTTYTFVAADAGKIKRFTHASGCSATVPNSLGAGFNCLWARSSAAGALTFVTGATIVAANGSGSLVASVGRAGAIIPEATDTYLISGDIGAVVKLPGSTSGMATLQAPAVAGTSTHTLPASTTTLAGLGLVQTFTKAVRQSVIALTDAATVTLDSSLGNVFYLLATAGVGATRALGAPSNPPASGETQTIKLIYQQSSGGSNALTFNAAYRHEGGTDPTASTAANAVDEYVWTYNYVTTAWDGGQATKGAA